MRTISIIALSTLVLTSCSRRPSGSDPVVLEELTIEVYDASRELGYTNKEAGFYYTESNRNQTSGWQGWHIMSRKVLDDYGLAIDGKELRREDVQLALVQPHQFIRSYKSGIQETVTLLDSVNALVVELSRIKGSELTLWPFLSESIDSSDYLVTNAGSALFVAKKNHPRRTPQNDYPAWIGVTFAGTESRAIPESKLRGGQYAPASLAATLHDESAVVILVAGDTQEDAAALLDVVAAKYDEMIQGRARRMEAILARAFVRTNNERFDKALHWAILSMDALVMNQGKKGIFAGLPWFSNYWGRDSFISLPGARLVTGNFGDAKAVLRSFAEWQEKNPGSPMYGRIPNLVTPTSISYNTTDGTPWFVLALGEYATMSGDTAFVREMFPAVKKSIEGSIQYRVDENFLLVHGDAETWMDAVGPDGPWSPRGNRGNDIQALWYKQLLTASWMADMTGDARSFSDWIAKAEKVRRSFNNMFINADSGLVYDHLRADGTPGRQLRPNQIFTLDMIDDQGVQAAAFRRVTEKLVYPHGVASLSQDDENFHPFHHYEPYYVQDAAYHNGIVWTWLAGPWISAATRYGYTELAAQVTDDMVHQILDRGAVGTLSELLDAAPRNGEKVQRLSGTFSQAWSLAEFIRVFYQDYLGVAIDATQNKIQLHPQLPMSITHATFNIPIGDVLVRTSYESSPSTSIVNLSLPYSAPKMDVLITSQLAGNRTVEFTSPVSPGSVLSFKTTTEGVTVRDSTGEREIKGTILRTSDTPEPLRLATPRVRSDLRALKPPPYRILTNQEIKASDAASTLLFESIDPENDDRGTGVYSYPTNPNFRPGILDITGFRVSSDRENVFFTLTFRSLSNPGWHPEYGYQLTFAAIAIDKDGLPGSGQGDIGRNARSTLPAGLGFESIIYVGGGVRLENSRGTVLAEYRPVPGDEKNPLGDVAARSISFSIPIDLIGTPEASWKYTVLVGAQDDHGGAGIGDFRSVDARATDWSGGGKKKQTDSNVYDSINPNQ